MNVGLRFDLFQPDGRYLVNPDNIAALDSSRPRSRRSTRRRPLSSRRSARASACHIRSATRARCISPTGISSRSRRSSILYKNPNFRIPLTGTYPEFVGNTIGNANLQPQRTVMYELGLQQEIAPNLGVTLTGYYKDIRNLLGLELHIKNDFRKFGEYVNRAYGAVRGITFSLDRRLVDGFGATLDYTFQIAKGDASDPKMTSTRRRQTRRSNRTSSWSRLGWDRRHSLNITLTVGHADNIIGSMIGRFGSGLPYTPVIAESTDRSGEQRQPPGILQRGPVRDQVLQALAPSGFRSSSRCTISSTPRTRSTCSVIPAGQDTRWN